MLLHANQSCVLLVDVQEKLISYVYEYQRLLENCQWVIHVAQALGVPVLASEQYPQGLGLTVPMLRELISDDIMTKVHFSCAADTHCMTQIDQAEKEQIVIIGIEAHVCVLQTAIELQMRDKQVYVIADAVSSRNPQDVKIALDRMQLLGIQIVSREMVFFEWVRQAGTPRFKELSKKFLRS